MHTAFTKLKNKCKEDKGFSLVEVVTVVAILGILVVIAIPFFGGPEHEAKDKAVKAQAYTAESMGVAALTGEDNRTLDEVSQWLTTGEGRKAGTITFVVENPDKSGAVCAVSMWDKPEDGVDAAYRGADCENATFPDGSTGGGSDDGGTDDGGDGSEDGGSDGDGGWTPPWEEPEQQAVIVSLSVRGVCGGSGVAGFTITGNNGAIPAGTTFNLSGTQNFTPMGGATKVGSTITLTSPTTSMLVSGPLASAKDTISLALMSLPAGFEADYSGDLRGGITVIDGKCIRT